MKKIFLLIPLILFGCSSADISYNSSKFRTVKKVFISPFTGSVPDKGIYKESEKVFSGTLKKLGLEVVEPDRNPSHSKITGDPINSAAVRSGADAVLTGEIIEHREYEEKKRGSMNLLVLPQYFGKKRDRNDIDTETVYRFRIALKMISLKNGEVILSAENRFPEPSR